MTSMPPWNQFMIPVLQELSDDQIVSLGEIRRRVAVRVGLTEEQLVETLQSGQTVADNRIGWAVSYLTRVDALGRPSRGHYRIAQLGRKLLAEHPAGLTEAHIRAHAKPDDQWWRPKPDGFAPSLDTGLQTVLPIADPTEQIEEGITRIHEDVAVELLSRIQAQDPAFFERAVVQLLVAMGYGGSEGKAQVTKASGDEGIDGIIDQDALGINRIYIQAKRYATNNPVGRPALQAFVGALSGKADSGVMITTSRFSQDAIDYSNQVPTRVIMVDGKRLAELMIRYGVGIQETALYRVIEVDEDFFE